MSSDPDPDRERGAEPGAVSGSFTVSLPHGLHARPAGALVGSIDGMDADVWLSDLTGGGPAASARSLLSIVALGAHAGHELQVRASGPDARAAVDAVLALAAADFGEPLG